MFFESGNIRLYYEVQGSGHPLIMLHGNGESHEIFTEAAAILRERFTVYLIDSRGHGQSMPVDKLHYQDMADDIHRFILELGIHKPILYGFSDGGIIGLLLASQHPELLSRVIASGVNVNPRGIKWHWLTLFRLYFLFTRADTFALMLNEPNITDDDLRRIAVPVEVIGGSRDMIRRRHMEGIARAIPQGRLVELPGEGHGSYVVHSEKIGRMILEGM